MTLSTLFMLAGLAALVMHIDFMGSLLGAFYAKGSSDVHGNLRPYVHNIHRAVSRIDVSATFACFFLTMSAFTASGVHWAYALVASVVVTIGVQITGWAGVQIDINRGVGRPDVNPDEETKAEIGDSGWWRPKIFYGRRRRWQRLVGVLLIVGVLCWWILGAYTFF